MDETVEDLRAPRVAHAYGDEWDPWTDGATDTGIEPTHMFTFRFER